eukprot:COSAG02_NODE_182_length_30594_cov_23.562912_8_plen_426_part_00
MLRVPPAPRSVLMLQLSVLVLMLASVCSVPEAAPAAGDPRCQNASTIADILSTGEVNLLRFGAFADGVTDDDDTLLSAIGCHNRVFIPAATHWPVAPAKGPPAYLVNSTVVLADSDPCPRCPRSVGQVVQLRGVGQHATPASVLRTHSPSPVIQVGDWGWKYSTGAKVTLQDLAIDAVRVGVLIVATSDVHLVRVSITVTEWGERGPPEVITPREDHAALVAVDVYWLYIDSCNFVGATPPGYDGQHNTSKRPSVIFRGQDNPSTAPSRAAAVNQVYLVTITDTVFNFGGIQYQQLSPRCSPPDAGFFEFKNVVQESSDTPLLDIVGNPNANASTRAKFWSNHSERIHVSRRGGRFFTPESVWHHSFQSYGTRRCVQKGWSCRHLCGSAKLGGGVVVKPNLVSRSRYVRCDVLRRAERSDGDGRG